MTNRDLVGLLQCDGEHLDFHPLRVGQLEIRCSGRKILNMLSELQKSVNHQVSAPLASYHVDDGKQASSSTDDSHKVRSPQFLHDVPYLLENSLDSIRLEHIADGQLKRVNSAPQKVHREAEWHSDVDVFIVTLPHGRIGK